MDNEKRNSIFSELAFTTEPVLVSCFRFFDGNEDDNSIGGGLQPHPGIDLFKQTFEQLAGRHNVSGVYMSVSDNNRLSDWPFTDTVYVVGSISCEELTDILQPLQPDEVGPITEFDYDVPESILQKHQGEKIQLIWWDNFLNYLKSAL